MVLGVASFRRRLKVIPRGLEDALKPIVSRYADQMVAQMKSLVPIEEGRLRDSIGWTFGKPPKGAIALGWFNGAGFRVVVYAGNSETIVTNKSGGEFQNARLQEFGTEARPASPYFFIAWRSNRRRIRAGITRATRKFIKQS